MLPKNEEYGLHSIGKGDNCERWEFPKFKGYLRMMNIFNHMKVARICDEKFRNFRS